MPDQLSTIERRVYHYLLDFLGEHTYQPSIREIGKRFRIKSTKTVSDILQSLADKGFIQRDPARSRGVRLLGYSTVGRMQPVPFYGKIAAGEPMLIPENRERYITLDRTFVPSDDCFFLRVAGDSMSAGKMPFPVRSSRAKSRCSERRVTVAPRCAAAAS